MKKFNFFSLLIAALIILPVFSTANAQQEIQPEAKQSKDGRGGRRPNLFRELGLSGEQMQQIRQLNETRKSLFQQAQRRVREATRNLDQAIYADTVNDAEIEARLKELQTAQSEIARLRATSELEVRKILTPEQLGKFRELRRKFAEMRENFDDRRRDMLRDGNKNAPNRRFNRQLRKVPNE